MDAMTIPDVWSGQDRTLTVEDMENMPDDEFRYELDDGVLIVSPAPPLAVIFWPNGPWFQPRILTTPRVPPPNEVNLDIHLVGAT